MGQFYEICFISLLCTFYLLFLVCYIYIKELAGKKQHKGKKTVLVRCWVTMRR